MKMREFIVDYQATYETCSRCGKAYAGSQGLVSNPEITDAKFLASLHACVGNPEILLAIAFDDLTGASPVVSNLLVLRTGSGVQMCFVEPEETPWGDKNTLGKLLTRQEALASPLKEPYFRIADVIVDRLPHLHFFLHPYNL